MANKERYNSSTPPPPPYSAVETLSYPTPTSSYPAAQPSSYPTTASSYAAAQPSSHPTAAQPSSYPTTAPSYPAAQPSSHPTNASSYQAPVMPRAMILGSYPVSYVCPNCKQHIVTRTVKKSGLVTWGIAGILCFFGCIFGCCLIPFCIDDTKDTVHLCPHCSIVLGEQKALF